MKITQNFYKELVNLYLTVLFSIKFSRAKYIISLTLTILLLYITYKIGLSPIISNKLLNILNNKILYFFIFLVGFIFTYLSLIITIKGYLGKILQNKLVNSLQETLWLNQLLIILILVYTLIIITIYIYPIYLDNTTVTVNVEGITCHVNGDYITEITRHLGSAAAFRAGAKIS